MKSDLQEISEPKTEEPNFDEANRAYLSEKTLSEPERLRFKYELASITGGKCGPLDETAEQRTEAFLRTKGESLFDPN